MKALSWLTLFFLATMCDRLLAQSYRDVPVYYVWDFGYSDHSADDFSRGLTDYFEAALLQPERVLLLERRKVRQWEEHKVFERTVLEIAGVAVEPLALLKSKQAEGVVFGKILDNVNAGVFEVTVKAVRFDGAITASRSRAFAKAKRGQPDQVQTFAEQLAYDLFPLPRPSKTDLKPFEPEKVGVLVCDFYNQDREFDKPGKLLASRAFNELNLLRRQDPVLQDFFEVRRVHASDRRVYSEEDAETLGRELKADVVVFGEQFCITRKGEELVCHYPRAKIRHRATATTFVDGAYQKPVSIAGAGLPQLVSADIDQLITFIIGWTYLKDPAQTQYQKAVIYLEQALQKAPDRHKANYDIRCYFTKALYGAGLFKEMLRAIEPLAVTAREENDALGLAFANGQLGLAFNNLGQWDKALAYYEKSLAIREEVGDRAGLGPTTNNIGNVYLSKKDYPNAAIFIDKSATILLELGAIHDAGLVYQNLAIVWVLAGEEDKAREYAALSAKLFRQVGLEDKAIESEQVVERVKVYQKRQAKSPSDPIAQARAAMKAGDWQSAATGWQQILGVWPEGENPKLRADIQCRLSICYIKLDRGKQAVPHLQAALAYFQNQSDDESRAMVGTVYNNLGSAYRSAGDWQQAEHWLNKSLDHATPLGGEQSVLAFTHGHLATLYFATDRPREAIDHARQSLTLCRKFQLKQRACETLTTLAEAYTTLDDRVALAQLKQDRQTFDCDPKGENP